MTPPSPNHISLSPADAAQQYHDGTKHPYGRLMDPHHRYGPGMEPPLVKIYRDLPAIHLPSASELPPTGLDLTLESIAHLLHYSAGVTRRITYPGWGTIPFRAAACTGALYHIELYLVCADLPGLPAGVYYYQPLENTLFELRRGDYRPHLASAAALPDLSPAYLVYTDIPFRNAIKYQARAYRHAFWDCGTILANSQALAGELGVQTSLLLGFADEPLNELLGIDGLNEYALALLVLGKNAPPPDREPAVTPLDYPLETPYRRARGLDVIQAIHHATSQAASEVNDWRITSGESLVSPSPISGEILPLPAPELSTWQPSLAQVIKRRGSSRRFTHQPIPLGALVALLAAAYQPYPADFLNQSTPALTQAYLVVNAVEGLQPGAYRYEYRHHSLARLSIGENRPLAGYLALGQALGADASICVYFLASLPPLLDRFGARGYRLAQMDGAIRAGRVYLAAYNQSLGATGLTFYDDEVTQFFSPAAAGMSVMFLVAVGVPASRREQGDG